MTKDSIGARIQKRVHESQQRTARRIKLAVEAVNGLSDYDKDELLFVALQVLSGQEVRMTNALRRIVAEVVKKSGIKSECGKAEWHGALVALRLWDQHFGGRSS